MPTIGPTDIYCQYCKKQKPYYDTVKGEWFSENRCRCYQRMLSFGLDEYPPVEGKCHICKIANADKRYASDPEWGMRDHGGTIYPWCLECIATYRVEQAIKAVKAMYDAMDDVQKKSGYEAYAALNDVWLKTADNRLALDWA